MNSFVTSLWLLLLHPCFLLAPQLPLVHHNDRPNWTLLFMFADLKMHIGYIHMSIGKWGKLTKAHTINKRLLNIHKKLSVPSS